MNAYQPKMVMLKEISSLSWGYRFRAWSVLLSLLLSFHLASAADSSNRLSVLVLMLENRTTNSQLNLYRYAGKTLLMPVLSEVKSIRVLPPEAFEYGFRQLNRKTTDVLELAQAKKVGEMVEARRVITGSFSRQGTNWVVTFQLMNVGVGFD